MDKAGNTDVGVAWMRGTTEGGGMTAAWTRRQHGQGGGMDKAAQTRCTARTRGPGGQHK